MKSPTRNHRRAAVALLATVVLVAAACGAARSDPAAVAPPVEEAADTGYAPRHARMAVFIMARCPHCAELLRELLPLRREMGSALELAFGYVGAVDALGLPALDRGDAEVAAALLQVCAALRAVDTEHLDFLECLYEGDRWRALPRGYEECAKRAGFEPEELAECAASDEGRDALGLAVSAAAASGIDVAPTMIIGERLYLGERTRRALLAHICHLEGRPETRPGVCAEASPPLPVEATLLLDARCDDPDICDVAREVGFLGMLVPTLELIEVDYSSPGGRRLHQAVLAGGGPPQVPMLIFGESLSAWPDVLDRMRRYIKPFGKGYLMPLGSGWDPTVEICDNGIDDTGNGLTDCADPDCARHRHCREEQPRRLDLFLMSRCPFAMGMMGSVDRFLDHFGRDRKQADLRLQFIGVEAEDGELTSMHGEQEVEENLRMICAQKLYPRRYAFMEYVTCRAAEFRSTDWERCVPKGLSAARIRKCAEGDEGRALLGESFRLARELEVVGSPSWVASNRHEMRGRETAAIVEAFCERNPQSGCERPVKNEPDDDQGVAGSCGN